MAKNNKENCDKIVTYDHKFYQYNELFASPIEIFRKTAYFIVKEKKYITDNNTLNNIRNNTFGQQHITCYSATDICIAKCGEKLSTLYV